MSTEAKSRASPTPSPSTQNAQEALLEVGGHGPRPPKEAGTCKVQQRAKIWHTELQNGCADMRDTDLLNTVV
ncbi:Short-chain dehydrogenase/reductase SDR [Penicillium vulpinum]|uniref:Short-chain dehydrogenase/reductase SDR n=1 Tax=Penicillium vulpinum TaxID=29845 RepID=UPI002547BFC6|nr:Short-chain dehydrogenase/reductase SDR [Penicillium vulpinum]KAJ5951236.1 Short-chain dehydrogenase/reductase SDR [Penicillium vulpinum]